MTEDIKSENEKTKLEGEDVEIKKKNVINCDDEKKESLGKEDDSSSSSDSSKENKEEENTKEEEVDDTDTNESTTTATRKEEEGKKEETAPPPKRKYTNWPLKGIKEPHEHDVLYGRGGGTNHHPGNKRYRKKVEERKLDYVNSKRLDKPLVALEIIKSWRSQDPPGRFLKLVDKTSLWEDVGDKKAREKTSQALREKAPEIRRKQEEDALIKAGKDPNEIRAAENMGGNKSTRFANGTKEQMQQQQQHNDMRRAALLRAHSLGQEYVIPGKEFALDGFSWDPSQFDSIPPNYGAPGTAAYPPGRHTSYGSQGAVPPQFPPSRNGSTVVPSPPPSGGGGEMYRNISHEERQQSFGSTSSWARLPSGGAPPPPPPYGGSPYSMRTNSFGRISREHSLQQNTLGDSSHSGPANGSGYYPSNIPPPTPHGIPLAYTNHASSASRYTNASGGNRNSQKASAGPDPFTLDPALAKTWSQDFEKAAGVFGNISTSWTASGSTSSRLPTNGSGGGNPRKSDSMMPRPGIVKRMTSNQNEDFETKPDLQPGRAVKRVALNRNNSLTSNLLKQQYAPSTVSLKKPTTLAVGMRSLSISTDLDSPDATTTPFIDNATTEKPGPLANEGRTDTIDRIAREIMQSTSKPSRLTQSGRTLTEDMLSNIMPPKSLTQSGHTLTEIMQSTSKPSRLTQSGRTLTEDMLANMMPPKPLTQSGRSLTEEMMALQPTKALRPTKPSALTLSGRGCTDEILAPIGDISVVPTKKSSSSKNSDASLLRPPTLRTEGRMSTYEYLDIVNEPLGQDDPGTNRAHWLAP